MPKTMLLVGTRKGLFVLDSEDRHDWRVRGPYCETWPIYRAVYAPAPRAGAPGRGPWNDPDKQPPGHLGLSAILPHPDDPSRLWVIVQGYGIFETTDGGESWTPRNRGLRADWPREDPEIGFCVHKL